MTTFAVTPTTGAADQAGAINYALNNIGQSLQLDLGKGKIYSPNGNPNNVYALLYPYGYIAFADDLNGNGFSYYSDGKRCYGITSIDIQPGVAFLAYPGNQNAFTWFEFPFGDIATADNVYYSVPAPYQLSVFTNNTGYIAPGEYQWPGPLFPPFFIDLLSYSAPSSNSIQAKVSNYPGTSSLFSGYNPDIPGLGYNVLVQTDLTYTTSSTTATNVLTSPNVDVNHVLTILPQASAPVNATTGSITVADAVTWDPATASTSTPYVAFYNGTAWVKLG